MTDALRQRLRVAIDTAVRAGLPEPDVACRGCGVAISDPWTGDPVYVDGCKTCGERRWGRARRHRQHSTQLVLIAETER